MQRASLVFFLLAGAVLFAGACHHEGLPQGAGDDAGVDATFIGNDDALGSAFPDGFNPNNVTKLTIKPSPGSVTAAVSNGVVTTTPLQFTAYDQDGNATPVAWSIDRGELGTLSSTGVFTANGINGGTANVTAQAGSATAMAPLSVSLSVQNLGAIATSGTGPQTPNDMGAPPSGGYNGVGGVPLGGAPPTATVTLLSTGSGTDASFALLYPYDQTVFPQGMLAPLLQWSVPAGFNATAMSVHLKQVGYEFYGYYAGEKLINAPIDTGAWTTATADNGGDQLLIEVKITDGTKVLGPLQLHFTIAPSRLRGTVYYNTYDSKLSGGMTNGSDGNGAVLRIDPGSPAPTLAVAKNAGQCYACHEVSTDGSTLFTATDDDNANTGGVFSLKDTTQAPLVYSDNDTPKTGGMFTYAGIYPDGSMALLSSQEDYHAWPNNSDLYSSTTEMPVGATGLTGFVTEAVTPAFSPDGTHAAFAFWAGAGNSSVKASQQTLAVIDFACGATPGSVACATGGPYAFSGLRTLYTDANAAHFVGWPSFTPDSKSVVFQHTVTACADKGSVLNTRSPGQAELWESAVPDTTGAAAYTTQNLCAANGYKSDCATSYLPTINGSGVAGANNQYGHQDDAQLNFEPNVTPIASGGYYWVVFTTRRLYGNVATTDPYFPVQNGAPATAPQTKKLWMAAIDPNPKSGVDPSHPAFYLPGQEINSGNMRAFWVNEPCANNGVSCQTGDQCCSGYCTAGSSGALACGTKPVGCVPQYDKCAKNSDCCGTLTCIDNLCSVVGIQ